MKRSPFFALLVLLFSSQSFAQEARIKGVVTDPSGKGLPGVNVVLTSTTLGTVTDENGKFEIRVTAGTYALNASLIGYKTHKILDLMIAPASITELQIKLEETVIELNEVQILGERQRQAKSDPQTSLRYLEPRSAKTLPGFGEDVLRSLQALPGVIAPSDFSAQLVIRGSGPDQNLIIVDDIEIFNPYRLYGVISMFNPETVSDISLISGGFPARYGDRLSAVLDVTNKEGSKKNDLHTSLNASISNANIVVEGKAPFGLGGSYLFSARRTYYDLIVGPIAKRSGLLANDAVLPNFADLQGKLVFGPFENHRIMFNGLNSRDGLDIISGSNRTNPDSINAFNETNHKVFGASWHYTPSEDFFSKAVVSYYRNDGYTEFGGSFLDPTLDRGKFEGPQKDTTGIRLFEISSQTQYIFEKYSGKQEFTWNMGGHTMEGGVGADFIKTTLTWHVDFDPVLKSVIRNRGVTILEQFSQFKDYYRLNAYLQDRIEILPGFYIQPGIRADYYKLLEKLYLSPRINAALAVDDLTTLRAALGVFYQSPGYEKLVDQRQNNRFNDLQEEYTRDLEAERSTHYVVGIDRWLTNEFQLTVDTYFKKFDNLISPKVVEGIRYATNQKPGMDPHKRDSWTMPSPVYGDSTTTIPSNSGYGESYGVEIFLENKRVSSAAKFYGWVSYALAHANRYQSRTMIPFDYDQRHTINLVGNYRLFEWLELGFHWRYGSNFPYTPPVGVNPRIVQVDKNGTQEPTIQTDAAGNVIFNIDRGGPENVNSAQRPEYHRLDARATAFTNLWGAEWAFYVDVINVYNRSNVLSYSYFINKDLSVGVRERTMFPLIPTLGLSVKF